MKPIQGIVPILPTPFDPDGQVDHDGLRRVAAYVVKAGAHGVAFPAVASEFYALSEHERKTALETVLQAVDGRIPVVATATATSAPVAVDLALHAEAAGAGAVMLMAPYVVKEPPAEIEAYFRAVENAVDLPLILQNAPAPLGSAQSTAAVVALLRAVPGLAYVKEENLPGGQRITTILREAPDTLRGVFGGAGGRYIIDELQRGAVGAMPACELTELHVALFEAFQRGDTAAARELYRRSLPLLTFQSVFRMNMTKEILQRRGIISSARVRVGAVALDEHDQAELGTLLDEVRDLLLEPKAV